jgi:hypothetical protein
MSWEQVLSPPQRSMILNLIPRSNAVAIASDFIQELLEKANNTKRVDSEVY